MSPWSYVLNQPTRQNDLFRASRNLQLRLALLIFIGVNFPTYFIPNLLLTSLLLTTGPVL